MWNAKSIAAARAQQRDNVTHTVGYMEMSYGGMTITRGMVKLYTPPPYLLSPMIVLTPTAASARGEVSAT